jgi:hypothetical protein
MCSASRCSDFKITVSSKHDVEGIIVAMRVKLVSELGYILVGRVHFVQNLQITMVNRARRIEFGVVKSFVVQ